MSPVKRRRADPNLTFDYKDTEVLRRFLSDRGRIRARAVTGLSPQQQRQLATAVRNAREMALLPFGSAR
ncbi:30S ribosomal protein S18 [Gordonia sp. HY002]|uniref:30S ribosomal protein S18 n=1 Tax=Gordonia zhenghanii TaxID=2911516 RepID=UPI001EEF8DED|nr:30S ribosomal protein S18 [Gordonia zhenghanii]MCF8569984.1 30S ribosomal protein S18 [Gordonia zhenghanii]MCF8604331.1 30S ribosomal protein S18 [Gordonia zhenghanii]MCF8605620.1 30S ribosomal protein S18 [Gordonia zhenghanii]